MLKIGSLLLVAVGWFALCGSAVRAQGVIVTECENHFTTGLPDYSYGGPEASVHAQTLMDYHLENDSNTDYDEGDSNRLSVHLSCIISATDGGDGTVVWAPKSSPASPTSPPVLVTLLAHDSVSVYMFNDTTDTLDGGSYSYRASAAASESTIPISEAAAEDVFANTSVDAE
jgi:hypothetical protein